MPPRRRKKVMEAGTDVVTSVPTKSRRGDGRFGDGKTEVNVPKEGAGNSLGDQGFVAWATDKGMLEEVGSDEDDIPRGVKMRFTGRPEDIGHSWQMPDPENRCNGMAKIRDAEGRYIVDQGNNVLKRPCGATRIRGGMVCYRHGGGVEVVKKAAQMRLLSAADALVGALIHIALDPKQDAKARVQAINSALDRAGVKGTVEIKMDVPKWKEMVQELFTDGWGADDDTDE